ncbi:RRM protein [Tulasnella sp. JGI-2019a]|nr:RRM protein [Tulasnella sp. JGI-2019a]
MPGSRQPWPTQGQAASMDPDLARSISTPWSYEGNFNDSYDQTGAYLMHPHGSHHDVQGSSSGYGISAPSLIDPVAGAYYGQQSVFAYPGQPVFHQQQSGFDQYNPYPNHAQETYQPQQNHLPASSITEHIISREPISPGPPQRTRSTLRFSGLEPWMDIEYFNGVCGVMGWENVILKVPSVTQPSGHGGGNKLQPNNPGYCFMTFATFDAATTGLAACRPSKSAKLMPNSKRPFNVVWATVPSPASCGNSSGDTEAENDQMMMAGLFATGSLSLLNPHPSSPPPDDNSLNPSNANRTLEYSIFVGDLAPETTNADLTAVFRDPILGLRLDREPKYVAPFATCKNSKIMVDPVLGMSKGYGFVRFGSASDASRALIEMQGLYCLSRPMRISQATAKARTQGYNPTETPTRIPGLPGVEYNHAGFNRMSMGGHSNLAMSTAQHQQNGQSNLSPHGSSRESPPSSAYEPYQTRGRPRESPVDPLEKLPKETLDTLSTLNIDTDVLAQLLWLAAKPAGGSPGAKEGSSLGTQSAPVTNQQFSFGDVRPPHRGSLASTLSASRSHPRIGTASAPARPITVTPGAIPTNQQRNQARALLASMVGANGAVQNSTDPYNTTVFVGGLSGLISEETLRTFFGEFGEIHYVKIPPGKGCGFVQFVKKADAEAAIKGLQGFPIGGGRVRLSWGRSRYKAAQAAAEAAQLGINIGQLGSLQSLSEDHTAQLLKSLGLSSGNLGVSSDAGGASRSAFPQSSDLSPYAYGMGSTNGHGDYVNRGIPTMSFGASDFGDPGPQVTRSQTFSSFAPFGGDTSSYNGSTLIPSRSITGINTLQPSQSSARQLASQGSKGNLDQYGLGDNQSTSNGSLYYDAASSKKSSHQSGYRPSEPKRQERANSGSTAGTAQTDRSSDDIYEIANNLSGLKFGHDAADDLNSRDAPGYQHQASNIYHPITKA